MNSEIALKFRLHLEELISLTDDEFEDIYSYFNLKKLRKHQFLVQEGDSVNHEYWVVEGLLKTYAIEENGKEHILQFGAENWWVSDYEAFFQSEKATINIDCIENSILLGLSLNDRKSLCEKYPKMTIFLLRKSNLGYVALQKRLLSMMKDSVDKRYEDLISYNPDLFQRLPKTLIAAYLGVSRETLSRLGKR
ncbi:Crp/Fnr family transcriptional regulator [Sediminitomix flava]|uniref:CRP-like cAMP-binding protein n=1 Tax=Sediminitomix flava TaxID=379075 RepID=A0A315ZXL5_SEDFL|nr:Crp/Fnr family transcriptional regulator [Sediminitomix flava]PWJ42087.1 CRP-like cAMP-binding protein [Sediminitomix flava]